MLLWSFFVLESLKGRFLFCFSYIEGDEEGFCRWWTVCVLVDFWVMGAKGSRDGSWRERSPSWNPQYGYPQSSYGQDAQGYPPPPPPPQQQPPYVQEYASGPTGDNRRRLDRRYSRIADNYHSLDEVRFFPFAIWTYECIYFLLFTALNSYDVPGQIFEQDSSFIRCCLM